MESSGIRSDDFAGLLAALGRGVSTTSAATSSVPSLVATPSGQNLAPLNGSVMPLSQMQQVPQPQAQPLLWQPVPAGSFPNMYPQPQFIAPSLSTAPVEVLENPKKRINPWIVGLLVAAVVICAAIAWMRFMTVRPLEEEEEEEEEDVNEEFKASARKEAREIPVPSSAYKQPHVEDYVAANVLKYVNSGYESYERDSKDDGAIDITGMDIPVQYSPPSPEIIRNGGGGIKKRIVADESQEVLDYAKRREALFSEKDT